MEDSIKRLMIAAAVTLFLAGCSSLGGVKGIEEEVC